MLPGFEVGHHQDFGMAGDGRLDALVLAAPMDGVVEGERAVEDAALDLAAVGHLAEGRGIERRLDLRVDRLDGRKGSRPSVPRKPRMRARSIAFCTM